MPYKKLRDEVGRLDLELTLRKDQTRELVAGRVAFLRRQEPWKLIAGGVVAGLAAGILTGRDNKSSAVSRLLSLTLGAWRLMPYTARSLVWPTVTEAGHERG